MIKLRLQQCLSKEQGVRGLDGQERGSRRKKGLGAKRWAIREETLVGRPVGNGKLYGSTCCRSLLFYQVKSHYQVKEETSLLGVLLLLWFFFFFGSTLRGLRSDGESRRGRKVILATRL